MLFRTRSFAASLVLAALTSCTMQPAPTVPAASTPTPNIAAPASSAASSDTPTPAPTMNLTPTGAPTLVPRFKHIVMVVLENKEFGTVVNNRQMPYFNELAKTYTLLTQHYAVAHPSLPNYLALAGGDTFGVTFDCTKCLYDAPSLPDQIEASGRTWKAYQEDMPSPCFAGSDWGKYAMKHNPFVYFRPIRLDATRCARSDVPLLQLYADLAHGSLPDYAFITPNLCNDAHDCDLDTADGWLKALMLVLLPALEADQQPFLVIVTWDEGQGDHGCCGLPAQAGGRVATILVSTQVQSGFEDATAYTHYSLLKTIEAAWGMPYLGHAADDLNVLITAPWKASR